MWFSLSLSTAILVSVADALSKKLLKTHTSVAVALIRPGWSSLFLLALLPWAIGPSDPASYWKPVLIAMPLEIAAALAFNRALQIAPLSLVIPYMAFTPVFLILGSRVFLGEHISPMGGSGIGFVTLGALLLQAPTLEAGRANWKKLIPLEKGPLLMLLVAFIFAITAGLAKKALSASSPLYFCGTYFPLIAVGLIPFYGASGGRIKTLFDRPKFFLLLGGLDAAALVCQFIAFQMAEIAYVVALKRLSLLLSVAWGWMFFQEEKSWTRLVGAGLMALGAGLIAFR